MNKITKIVILAIWIILTILGIFSNILFTNDLSNPIPLIALGQAIFICVLLAIFKTEEKERFIFYFLLLFLLPGLLMFEFEIVLLRGEEFAEIMEPFIAISVTVFVVSYIIIIEKMLRNKD